MTTSDRALVVDADGHVLEPRDTWIDYIEPAYRGPRDSDRRGRAGPRGAAGRRPAAQVGARLPRRARRHRARPRRGAHPQRAPLRGRLPARWLRPRRAPPRHGRRGHRHRAPLSHHRHLLGGARHRRRRWPPPTPGPTTATSSTSAPTTRSGWCRWPTSPSSTRWARSPRSPGPARRAAGPCTCRPTWRPAAAVSSTTRPSTRSGAAADLDMPVGFHVVVRDQPVFRSLMPKRRRRQRAVLLRLPRHRRDGGLHPDAGRRRVREAPEAALHGARIGRHLDLGLARPHGPQVSRS